MQIAAVIAVLVVLIGIPVVAVNRDLLFNRRAAKRARVAEPLPFLIIPSYLGAAETVPSGVTRHRQSTTPDVAHEKKPASFAPPDLAAQASSEAASETKNGPSQRSRWMESFEDYSDLVEVDERHLQNGATEPDEIAPDATVIFNRPVDEPMQILPGRLQVISGEPATEDLRFFSRLGEPPRIVVGRDSGPPHRHITLHSPTVSRRHARIDFENGSWTITNLSQTNPVLVNDRVLTNGGSARKLSDGDRIELGEVALRFRTS